MSSYLDTVLQYYPNDIKQVKPIGELTLYQWLYSIKHPKQEIMQLFLDIEQASAVGDLKKKAELKKSLYYVVPSTFSDGKGRSYSNIKHFTEIMVIDVDNLEPEYAIQFKEYLFNTYSFFIAVYLSPSRKGVKGLVRIPKCQTVEEFKQYFNGLMATFQEYKGVDFATRNAVLAHFITYDPQILYRLDATVWNGVGIQIDEFKPNEEENKPLEYVDPKDLDGIKLMIKRMVDNIDIEQVGHLPIRSVSLLIGGWIKYGYFDYDTALDYLFDCMESSSYLQKGMRGYKKTAVDMIRHGMLSGLKYERN